MSRVIVYFSNFVPFIYPFAIYTSLRLFASVTLLFLVASRSDINYRVRGSKGILITGNKRKAHEGHHKRQGVSVGRKDEQVEWTGKPSKKQHAGNLVKKKRSAQTGSKGEGERLPENRRENGR